MTRRPLPARLLAACAALLVGVGAGCRPAAPEVPSAPVVARTSDPAALHAALGRLTDVMMYDIFSPPQAARAYAYASVAAYEAARPGRPDLASLAGQLNGLTALPAPPAGRPVHHPLAGLRAFYRVAQALTFSDEVLAAYEDTVVAGLRAAGLPDAYVDRSLAYGDAVADHVLAWAGADGYRETRGGQAYTVTPEAGRWRPTPPGYIDAVEPNWSRIRPFVLDSAAQFRVPPPPRYDVAPGSPFGREVREVYAVGRALTDEQRAIANFWDCNPYKMNTRGHAMFATKKITPGGHWMGIAGIAARARGLDFAETAEVFAKTGVALADGFLAVWDEKYRSNVVRPETVINEHVDEAWAPVLQTPPFPEYPSGHSGISAAAAAVLTDRFGDAFAFADSTEVAFGLPVRSFPSFHAAAEEAALSRLYGGIHYRMSVEAGLTQGAQVGARVVERLQTRRPAVARR